jgi:peptidoglycan DL-endopeptidase RipA
MLKTILALPLLSTFSSATPPALLNMPVELSVTNPPYQIVAMPPYDLHDGGGGGSTKNSHATKIHHGLSALSHQVQKRRWYSWGAGHGSHPGPTYGFDDGASNHHTAPQRFGFDCSGFSRFFVFKASGRDLLGSGTAASQLGRAHQLRAKVIPASRGYKALKKGDLLFYGNSSKIHHVAIYAGGGRIYEAPQSNMRVHLASTSRHNDYYAAMRIPF